MKDHFYTLQSMVWDLSPKEGHMPLRQMFKAAKEKWVASPPVPLTGHPQGLDQMVEIQIKHWMKNNGNPPNV